MQIRKRLCFGISILSISLLFTSCMSMVMDAGFSQMKSPNYIPLHENAQIGDYSIYKSITKSEAMVNPESVSKARYEVVGKEGVLYVIRLRFFETAVSSMEKFGFEYWVDKEGWVKKAFLLKGKGDDIEKTVIDIAMPKELGHVVYYDLQTQAKVKNSTREFANVKLYRADYLSEDPGYNLKSITFFALKDDVPFRIVFGNTISDLDYLASDTSKVGKTIITSYSWEKSKSGTATILIESGNTMKKTSTIYAEDYVFVK